MYLTLHVGKGGGMEAALIKGNSAEHKMLWALNGVMRDRTFGMKKN